MYEFIKIYVWAFYLGASVAKLGNMNVFDWRFHAIVLPVIFLESWSRGVYP